MDHYFKEQLEQAELLQAKAHAEALAIAAQMHYRVREEAEQVRLMYELDKELEQQRLGAMRQQEIAQKEQQLIAEKSKEAEALRQLELRRQKQLIEERAKEAEAQALQERLQREAQIKLDEVVKAAAEPASASNATSASSSVLAPAPAPSRTDVAVPSLQSPAIPPADGPLLAAQRAISPVPKPAPAINSSSASRTIRAVSSVQDNAAASIEATHQAYLAIHQRLKEMRASVVQKAKQIPALKSRIGDMRRDIKKSVGQLTGEKGANRIPNAKVLQLIAEASRSQHMMTDVTPFFLHPPGPTPEKPDNLMPGLLIYLLSIFSKAVINQFLNEAAVSPKAADPVGILAALVFADPLFKFRNAPFIDILIAKYHKVCPILFGIYGDDKTEGGRKRLGWFQDDGGWAPEQRHGERMTGLGAGYAALTLRDFSRSKNINPYPNRHYWKAMAAIINTPPSQTSATHFVVLKAMVEHYVDKFLVLYGGFAKLALRRALIEFPASVSNTPASSAVAVLPEIFKRDLRLTI